MGTVAGVAAGRELCLCYGPLQNFELLLYYGFCLQDNPHDRLTVSMDPPPAEDSYDREVLLQLRGIPTEHVLLPGAHMSQESPAGSSMSWASIGCLPPQLLRCLRILLATSPESVDVDVAPGAGESNGEMLSLDLYCLDVLDGLLASLAAPFSQSTEDKPLPLWWPEYGDAVSAFHASQMKLI